MKTEIPLLWIDDNKDFMDALKDPLESWIEGHGFSLNIHYRKNAVGILKDLRELDIDFIVLDYHLGKKDGDVLIGEIREANLYHDIVFYSQGGGHRSIFQTAPDGVFFVDRADAKQRIKNLIDFRIRRASELPTLRGWIVADSIELEAMLVKSLRSYFIKHKKLSQERAIKALSDDGAFFFGRLRMFLSEILKDHMEHLTFSEDGIFDFGAKHKILNGLLKDHISILGKQGGEADTVQKLQGIKKILDLFPKEIIEVRNALAHQIAEVAETGHKKIKTKTKEALELVITPSLCATIRKNVRKHFENLSALALLV